MLNKVNKNKFKIFVIGTVIISVATTSLLSFGTGILKTIEVAENSVKLKVNGVDSNANTYIIDGRTYVQTRSICDLLGKDLSWDASTSTVDIKDRNVTGVNVLPTKDIEDAKKVNEENSQPNEKSTSNISGKMGNIKGVVTWQYNKYVGTKPDTDAKIALIPEKLKPTVDNEFFSAVLSQVPQGENGIYTTSADGYGNYEIQDVLVGNYYLLIISKNTISDFTIQPYDKQRLQPLFTEKGWQNLEINLKLGKVELRTIEIKENKTINESYDFGNTYF